MEVSFFCTIVPIRRCLTPARLRNCCHQVLASVWRAASKRKLTIFLISRQCCKRLVKQSLPWITGQMSIQYSSDHCVYLGPKVDHLGGGPPDVKQSSTLSTALKTHQRHTGSKSIEAIRAQVPPGKQLKFSEQGYSESIQKRWAKYYSR